MNSYFNYSPEDIAKSLFFTGVRPSKMPGRPYDLTHSYCRLVINNLKEFIKVKLSEGKTKFLIGGAIGMDTLAAIALLELRSEGYEFEIILCVPFSDQPIAWIDREFKDMWEQYVSDKDYDPNELSPRDFLEAVIRENPNAWFRDTVETYYRIMDACDIVVEVDSIRKYNLKGHTVGRYDKTKLLDRNKFMADHGSEGIALSDGTYGGTKHCIDYARKIGRPVSVADVNNPKWI